MWCVCMCMCLHLRPRVCWTDNGWVVEQKDLKERQRDGVQEEAEGKIKREIEGTVLESTDMRERWG